MKAFWLGIEFYPQKSLLAYLTLNANNKKKNNNNGFWELKLGPVRSLILITKTFDLTGLKFLP
jgi:hypothetical protein